MHVAEKREEKKREKEEKRRKREEKRKEKEGEKTKTALGSVGTTVRIKNIQLSTHCSESLKTLSTIGAVCTVRVSSSACKHVRARGVETSRYTILSAITC